MGCSLHFPNTSPAAWNRTQANAALCAEKDSGSERSSPPSPVVPTDSRASSLSGKGSRSTALPAHHPHQKPGPSGAHFRDEGSSATPHLPHTTKQKLYLLNRKTMTTTCPVSRMPKSLRGANTPLGRDPGKSHSTSPSSSEQQVSALAGVEPSIGAVTAAQGMLVDKPLASCFISRGWQACLPPVHSLFLLLSGRAPSPVNPKNRYINRFLKPRVQRNKQCQLYMDNSGWVVTTAGPGRPGLAITHNNERMLLILSALISSVTCNPMRSTSL